MDSYTHRTINSFTQKPGCAQIFSYIVFTCQLVLYYVCVHPALPSPIEQLAFGIAYPITIGVLVIFTLVSSIIDPSDPTVREYKENKAAGYVFG